jgi:acyl-CoA dehydrogenase
MWRFMRMLRVADGPDEVHKMVIARRELNRAAKRAEAAAEGVETTDDGAAPAEPAKAAG